MITGFSFRIEVRSGVFSSLVVKILKAERLAYIVLQCYLIPLFSHSSFNLFSFLIFYDRIKEIPLRVILTVWKDFRCCCPENRETPRSSMGCIQ